MGNWRLLSNHGLTLICLARNPEMTLRQIGDWVGVTERSAHEIVKELCADGYLSRSEATGRRRYTVHPEMHLRHPEMQEHTLGEMLSMLVEGWSSGDGPNGATEDGERRRFERQEGSRR